VSKIAVVGTGYVGAVVASCLASIGHEVVGVEIDPARLESLRSGIVPFHEPGLPELVSSELEKGSLEFTDSYQDAMDGTAVTFLCVGTPALPDGSPDTTQVESAARSISEWVTNPMVVVTKSTVPIGSGRWLNELIDGERVSIASNPEFLREGSALKDFLYPDRIVLGSDDPAAIATLVEVYRPIIEQSFTGGRPDHRPGLVRTNLETAEIVKYAANVPCMPPPNITASNLSSPERWWQSTTDRSTSSSANSAIGSISLVQRSPSSVWRSSRVPTIFVMHPRSRWHGV